MGKHIGNIMAIVGSFLNKYNGTKLKSFVVLIASFWTNNFSRLLSERPNISVFTISGFWSPWEPLFMDLNLPGHFKASVNMPGDIIGK